MAGPDRVGSGGSKHEAAGKRSEAGGAWVDRRVLEGVRRRDADAMTRFFDASFPYVYNLAFRLLGNRDAVEDVVQDVFLKVYRAADKLDVDRDPKPWLTTITYNTCRDMFRRAAARPERPEDPATIADRQRARGTPEDELLRKEQERQLEEALLQLDDESRAVVILRDFCGASHDDIAAITENTVAAVRKRYSRALKTLAQIIRGLQR